MDSHGDEDNQPSASSMPAEAIEVKQTRKRRANFETELYYGSLSAPRRVYKRQRTMTHLVDLPSSTSLKNVLYNCIVDVLTENTETRRVAEEKIGAMEIIDEFAIHLCEFSQNSELNFAVRQMSSVLLKQYIDAYWSTSEEHNIGYNFALRNRIRKQLLVGLHDPNSKIRNAFAYCISYTGTLDYPDKWPTFFEDLKQVCNEDPKYGVHGILRVYEDVLRDSNTESVNIIAEPLLTELCFLLTTCDKFDVHVRISAMHVLCLFVNFCGMSSSPVRLALSSKLSPVCEFLVKILLVQENSVYDYGLKTNIIRFYTLAIQKFPINFSYSLTKIVPTILEMIMRYAEIYATAVVNNKTTWLDSEDDEGKVVGFTPLVLSLLDFIHSLIDSPGLFKILFNVLSDIFYCIFVFMHITKNMEDAWMADPTSFVKDDSEENFDTSIRVTARDVLMIICHDLEDNIVVPSFSQAISRLSVDLTFIASEWKVHECIMFALGSIKSVIIEASFTDTLQFRFLELTTAWQFALAHPELPLLLGRTLWFSGKFSTILTPQLFDVYMKSTIECLKNYDVIIQMFAARSVYAHCVQFMHNPNKHCIVSNIPEITERLLENLNDPQSLPVLFTINLSTLNTILTLGLPTFKETMEPRITSLIINLFLKHYADPDIIEGIRLIIMEYCLHSQASVQQRAKFTPILANALNSTDDTLPYGLQTVAMDLLETLVRCSKPPLTQELILVGFPATIKCILQTDDQFVLSNGGECLRSYLLMGAEQICGYTDSEGTNGIQYVLRAITHLLDPSQSEDACKRVGRLIITLINKTGAMLGEHIHYILRAVLSKMQRVEHKMNWLSLILVFVYLFYMESEFVTNFLTSVPGPTGASALEFVLKEWIVRETYFTGFYNRTLCMVAFTKLLEYSVTAGEGSFAEIMISDEYVSNGETVITQIPILGKAFRLICAEASYLIEKSGPSRSESESGDGSDSDAESSFSNEYRYYNFGLDQHDILYGQDPVFNINVLPHISEFLQKFKRIPRFSWYVNFLNSKEKNALASLGFF